MDVVIFAASAAPFLITYIICLVIGTDSRRRVKEGS